MKHEKALVLLLAYIIGFITAYIAFGIDDRVDIQRYDNDIESVAKGFVKHERNHHYESVSTTVSDDGFYALLNDKKRILSAFSDSDQARPGYHKEVITSQTSNDGNFIYYCTKTSDGSYDSYMYDVAADHVYMMDEGMLNNVDEKGIISAEWSSDGRLSVGNLISSSQETPWLLIAK